MRAALDCIASSDDWLLLVGSNRLDNCLWLFKAFWLYAAVEPATGASFFLQFSHVDTQCYQRFLNEFSKAYSESLNILQVDNGRFHKGRGLVVPENIILLFQPPYCPELNPTLAVVGTSQGGSQVGFVQDVGSTPNQSRSTPS